MARKWEDAGKYAGTGAAIGGTIGSIVPGVGTAIGTAAGAVIGGIGGFIGGSMADDNNEEEQERLRIEKEAEQERQRKRALKEYLLGEAYSLDGDKTAYRAEKFKMGIEDLERGHDAQDENFEKQVQAFNETSPDAFVGLANAGARVGQTAYNAWGPQAGAAPSAKIAAPAETTVNPANLAAIPPPNYTPSKIQDPSLSPEVQEQFDAANLGAIRKGRRVGF